MSFSLSPLHDNGGGGNTNAPIEEVTFISHFLPPVLCYFVMAMLAVTPQTRTIRLALFPAMMLLALRAAAPLYMSLGHTEQKFDRNSAAIMFLITARALSWALARKPLVRQLRPVSSTPSTLLDAFDLVTNFRGHGWDWSRGVYIPRETRPSNRSRFIFHTILSAATHTFAFGILNTAIGTFSSASFGTLSGGGSIFDESLPSCLRYLRSSVISIFAFLWNYTAIQILYDLFTIVGVLILGQELTRWPPSFDAPWRATSLTDFWGRRWHQWFRHIFPTLGGYPLSFILGRPGIVIGAFLTSAVHHHIQLTALNNDSEFWRMLIGFGMMGLGIIIEDIFKDVTGKEVHGLSGWVWTMGWNLLWGNVIIEGYTRAGLFRSLTFIDSVTPVRVLVEYLVTEFDSLLHAIPNVLVA